MVVVLSFCLNVFTLTQLNRKQKRNENDAQGHPRLFSVQYLFGEAHYLEFFFTLGRLKISSCSFIHVQFSKLI